jgi:NADH:ubiquinone oxidoreductase subunit F (NADH-binding)/NADH:ubiquinone oxidoreductase subunit E
MLPGPEPAALLQRRRGRPALGLLERLSERRDPGGALTHEMVEETADAAGLPPAAVVGATSYYAELGFARRGRRHVRLCGGTACFAASAGRHIAEVERALGVSCGQGSDDGEVSLDESRCLGCCYGGPAALDGDELHAGSDLAAQLGGAAQPCKPPIPVRAAVQRPVLLAGILGGERPWGVWPALASAGGSADRVLRTVQASGLRGRGGAGFPVAAKWRSALAHPAPRVVVANGDEGDPGSFADRLLMERDPGRVLEGLALAGLACGAQRGFVYVRSEYPAARKAIQAAADEARARGLLGDQVGFDIEVVSGHGSYVAGEETGVIHALEGLRGSVKPRPPYPTEQGWLGYPTIVNNVETLAAVPWIVACGADLYATLGSAEEPGTKLVSLGERFAKPGVVEVEIGVSLRHVVEELGGGLRDGARLVAVQVGGPLGGVIAADELDVPMSSTSLAAAGAALGHGGIVAFDERISGPELVRHLWSFAAAESCGACSPCRVGSRRGLELAERAARGEDDGEHEALCEVMKTASLCAFGRTVPAGVRSAIRVYRP